MLLLLYYALVIVGIGAFAYVTYIQRCNRFYRYKNALKKPVKAHDETVTIRLWGR